MKRARRQHAGERSGGEDKHGALEARRRAFEERAVSANGVAICDPSSLSIVETCAFEFVTALLELATEVAPGLTNTRNETTKSLPIFWGPAADQNF